MKAYDTLYVVKKSDGKNYFSIDKHELSYKHEPEPNNAEDESWWINSFDGMNFLNINDFVNLVFYR